jgi:hypothetical protein
VCSATTPYAGTLPFTIHQQSCTKATLTVHLPETVDVWVLPPKDTVPFVAPRSSLLVQPIDRVYFGNDTLEWRILPLDASCLGWSIQVPVPDDCVKEQTLLVYVQDRVFVSYLAFSWTLVVLVTSLGTWFGFWVRYPTIGELGRLLLVYYQIPAFVNLGFSTLTFTTALGFLFSVLCIVGYCAFDIWTSGRRYLTFPTRVNAFSVFSYFLYVATFIVSFATSIAR